MDKVLLEDVCNILDNKRVPITECDRKKGPYPYYGANGVQDYVDDYIFDDELVLLAEDGGNFGSKEKPIAYRVSGKCWVNNHAHVLKPKENIDVNYLCYSLMFYDVSGFVNGATRQKLTQSNMRQMLIPFCSLADQQRIADELDKVSGLIEKRQKQLEKLDLLIKSRFVEMFSSEESLKWGKAYLGNVCDVRDGTHDSPKYILENGFPLVTSKNVVNGEIDFKDTNLISKEDFDKINQRSRVNVGDIIMPMIGTIGRPVIVNTNREFAIKNVALIKFVQTSNSRVKNVYIKYLLESDVFEEIKTDLQRGGTQKFISLGDIRKMAFRLPPIELQNQFADFVEKVEQNKSKIKNSLDKLITLKKALMQKYFG